LQIELSPEDAAFQAELREFFTTRVPGHLRVPEATSAEVGREAIVETQRILNSAGLAVPTWPAEWGGRDWSTLRLHIWHQEMQRAGVVPPFAQNVSMVGPVIATFGSTEMKERFLPPTANMDIFWAQGFSEPEAGSDLASLRTSAVLDGDEWVVNGQKAWTTLAHYADWIFCLVRTDPSAPKRQQGISFLLIDLRSPGVTVRPTRLVDGCQEVNEVFFDDVRVPADQLVGEVNRGWDYAKFLLGNERIGVAPVEASKQWLAVGKAQAARPVTGGSPLLDDPVLAQHFVDLENELMALELTALRVAGGSHTDGADPASSVLKLRGTQLQQAVTELLTEIGGPGALAAGAGPESAVDPSVRDALPRYLNFRKASIYGGSNEIQRQIIASSILGL
jgi:alkylation response protein AidB-like acyl-CoA dehydrogenase